MNPLILLSGVAGFAFSLLLHIVVWRIRRPKNDVLWLFLLFAIFPFFIDAAWALAALSGGPGPFSAIELAAVFALQLALGSAYIQFYPGAQAVSPSLEMVLVLSRHWPDGLAEAEIARHFDDKKLVGARVQDLLNMSLVRNQDGALSLKPVGRGIIRFYVWYRKMIGLEFTGG